MDYNKEWYLSVLNAINDMILVKGEKSRLLWANKAFCDYYKMTNEELMNIVDSETSDPDDTIQYVKDDHYVYTKDVTLDIPSEAVTDGDGNISYFHTIKNPIKGSEGITDRTVGVSRLIENEELIKHSKKLRTEQKTSINDLRTFVDKIPSPVMMLDQSKRIITYSESWVNYFLHKDGLKGQNFEDSFKEILPINSSLDDVTSTKERIILDVVPVNMEGKISFFKVLIDPWSMSSGDIGGVMIVLNDITSEIEKEKALQKHNEELKQFAYITTHDVKSPITNIQSFLQLLQEDDSITEPSSLQAIHWISKSIEKANTKINDLVKVIEQRESSILIEKVDLESFIDDLKISINVDDLSLSNFLKTDIKGEPFIYTSKKQLTTILENLLTNALRYRKNREQVIVDLLIDTSNNNNDIIKIKDNGIGIDLRTHGKKIFEMFKRANDKVDGNGLGLYLTKQACEQLKGDIEVQSVLNEGTDFIITLPKNKI